MKRTIVLMMCVSIVLLSSCGNFFDPDTKKTISISSIEYSITNYPEDWYSSTSIVKPSLQYYFSIKTTGNYLQSDVKYVRIYLPNNSTTYWDLMDDFDDTSSSYSGNCYYGDNSKELPIGTMNAVIELDDSTKAAFAFTMGRPGNVVNDGYSYTYASEDETMSSYPSVSIPSIMRPIINALSLSSSLISVDFTVYGQYVFDGVVWFYDATGNYIGRSPFFRDRISGAIISDLNSGIFNNGNGQVNTMNIGTSEIANNNNQVSQSLVNTISTCRVILYDGIQYATDGNYGWYDYKSISSQY